jgi:hypothetical protein
MAITISGDSPNFTSASATTITGVTTLNGSSGVLATQNGMTGIPKAWVNFNGVTTVTIRASFNIASVVRNGTGDYTITFTTAMPDANYVISGTASRAGTTGQASAGVTVTPNDFLTARTTTSFRIILLANAGDGAYDTAVDSAQVNILINGN